MTDLIRLRGDAITAGAIVGALKSDAAVIAERVLPLAVLDPLRAEVEGVVSRAPFGGDFGLRR